MKQVLRQKFDVEYYLEGMGIGEWWYYRTEYDFNNIDTVISGCQKYHPNSKIRIIQITDVVIKEIPAQP